MTNEQVIIVTDFSIFNSEYNTERMTSTLSFNIDNLNLSNLNITQGNEAINRVVLPPSSLILVNRITMIFNQ